jgi:hypothetical protein
MAEGRPLPIKLFFSYTHKDARARERLSAHLSLAERQGLVQSWHDRKIPPGADWEGDINDHLNSADIIVLLISADFIASKYCWEREMARALERNDLHEAIVVPVVVAPVDWMGAPFGRLQMLPPSGKPVALWRDKEEAWFQTSRALRDLAERLVGGHDIVWSRSGPATVLGFSSKPLSVSASGK